MWFIGKNSFNECDVEDDFDKDVESTRQHLRLSKTVNSTINNITNIHASDGFTIYIQTTMDDEYVTYGYIRNIQQLLQYKNNSFFIIPSSIIALCLQFFGNNYNKYWSSGKNYSGQCGTGHLDIAPLSQIKNISNIKQIYSGNSADNILWITFDGKLYVNGRNDCHQLGIEESVESVDKPIVCRFFEDKYKYNKCIDAASSDVFCLVLCDDGSVWSSGGGSYGENGHAGNPSVCLKWTQIETLSKYKIIQISAGDAISMFLCDDGNIYGCGCNDDGSLGLGHFDDEETRFPTQIPYFVENNIKIIKVLCGMDHVIALDINGKIYCWGSNSFGQCAIQQTDSRSYYENRYNIPEYVECLNKEFVIDIKAGKYHNACITKDGNYYCWGSNRYSECMTDGVDKAVIPNCINQYVMKLTHSTCIIDIALGRYTTMVLMRNDN